MLYYWIFFYVNKYYLFSVFLFFFDVFIYVFLWVKSVGVVRLICLIKVWILCFSSFLFLISIFFVIMVMFMFCFCMVWIKLWWIFIKGFEVMRGVIFGVFRLMLIIFVDLFIFSEFVVCVSFKVFVLLIVVILYIF